MDHIRVGWGCIRGVVVLYEVLHPLCCCNCLTDTLAEADMEAQTDAVVFGGPYLPFRASQTHACHLGSLRVYGKIFGRLILSPVFQKATTSIPSSNLPLSNS